MVVTKGPFKYYVSKEVGMWGGQMLMFADKVGGWEWPNAVSLWKQDPYAELFTQCIAMCGL